MDGAKAARQAIVEFQRIGASVKVSVVDAETLTEVSIVGPASASRADLERAALRKLAYVLARKHG